MKYNLLAIASVGVAETWMEMAFRTTKTKTWTVMV